jgi:hypothetical protein
MVSQQTVLPTRKALFRGKCIETGLWFLGDLRHWWTGGMAITYWVEDKPGICIDVSVDPETAGQFTGLFDLTGKQIFEGDIVISHTAKKSPIWQDFIKGYIVSVPGRYMLQCPCGQVDIFAMPRFEVIGNIHDGERND